MLSIISRIIKAEVVLFAEAEGWGKHNLAIAVFNSFKTNRLCWRQQAYLQKWNLQDDIINVLHVYIMYI